MANNKQAEVKEESMNEKFPNEQHTFLIFFYNHSRIKKVRGFCHGVLHYQLVFEFIQEIKQIRILVRCSRCPVDDDRMGFAFHIKN